MAQNKCFQLMTDAEFQKMKAGKDYESPASTYAPDKRGAEATFKRGKHCGTWVMVWGDGPKDYKVVHL